MASYRSRKARRQTGNGMINTAVVGVAVAATSLAAANTWTSPPVDGPQKTEKAIERLANGCLAEPPATHVVALDGSTAFSDQQWAKAPYFAQRAFDRLPPEGRLLVFKTDAEPAFDAELVFDACAPGNDKGTAGYRDTARRRIKTGIAERLGEIERPEGADRPSTAWALQELMRRSEPHASRARNSTRLSVFSTFEDEPPHVSALDAFENVDVEMIQAERVSVAERDQQEQFRRWRTYFEESGAHVAADPLRVASGKPEPRDEAGCLLRPVARTILAVDATDPYAPRQWEELRRLVAAEAERLPADGVLDLHVMGERPSAIRSEPTLHFCASNVESAIASSGSRFSSDVLAAFDTQVSMPRSARRSPIQEHLRSIFRIWPESDGDLRLVVFSDMLFNSDTMSFMDNGRFRFDDYPKREELDELLVDLKDVEVEVFLARRDSRGWGAMQNETHRSFVRALFEKQGAMLSANAIVEVHEG